MSLKIVECPRDAMQGLHTFIDTDVKISYINQLLKVGFDTIDFGSFVSPKAIPQMKDTREVLAGLDLSATTSKLLAIVANARGAEEACGHPEIAYLGYPFSISETFQQRNTNASIADSLARTAEIQELCLKHNKTMVVYISMAFGNPYGDAYSPEIALKWSEKLAGELGIKVIALSDTIGSATPELISDLFASLIPALPGVEIGAHLHSVPYQVHEKVKAAYDAGCRRFDGALKGFGGCPMAKDDLTGNMNTELMIDWFAQNNVDTGLNHSELQNSLLMASATFPG
ncbi:MAG: hydroxymethylglutaryl-CoA lyase [Bacteroidota bacterium]